jgi:acetolactate synthase-1/3 small subunit
MQKIIIATVTNKSGVLNRVSSLLRRRNFNILSLTVAPMIDKKFSKMTISLDIGVNSVQVSKHLHKLIDVLKVVSYNYNEIILHESLFLKVNATRSSRSEVLQFGEIYKVNIVNLSEKDITFQYSSHPNKIDEFIEIMTPFGIKDIVRSGATAIGK